MAFWMVFLVVIIAVGSLVLYILRDQSIAREKIGVELHDSRTPTLEYSVPTGQDPVPILAVLERAGYVAGVDSHGAHQVVMVKCPEGPEHERTNVRTLIESAHVGAVRFRDED